ncbi:MAG: SigB/SigF/SigG family RNA polymerase sigma factor [Clostridiales bacterium]|nr:SigB/SigF/SigG family RNA polymerase sigma factor [Clostridiales bacterium]
MALWLRWRMLDNDQVLRLVQLAQQGDLTAKGLLVEENAPLIKSVIKRFRNKGIEYEDLYQIGCMGFLKAMKNFNPDFKVKFSTYVVPMVIGEVKRFMRDDGAIKVSRALKTLNLKINKFIEQYYKDKNTSPTIEEIALHFEVDSQDVILAMDSAKMPISLSTPIEDDSESITLVDRIESEEDENAKMIDNLALSEIIKKMDERDKKIILLRYYFDKTQSEIAKELNISQVQVSRLENKILENMRNKLTS